LTVEQRAKALKFFLDAGFLSDPQGKIKNIVKESPDQLPSFDRILPNLESPNAEERRAARFELGVSGAGAIPSITQLLESNPDPAPSKFKYFQVLGAIQALAIMAPKHRCLAYKTNPQLRHYVEMYSTNKEETLNAAVTNALLCPP
jgi:hypothetical protein